MIQVRLFKSSQISRLDLAEPELDYNLRAVVT